MRSLLFALCSLVLLAVLGLSLVLRGADWVAFASGTPEQILAELQNLPSETGIHSVGEDQLTPLQYAIFHRASAVAIQTLLEAGADPNDPMDSGIDPVQLAGSSYFVEGYTPLTFALSYGHDQAVSEALIEAGADIFVLTDLGRTTLHLAADAGYSAEFLQYLIDEGVAIDAKDLFEFSALLYASLSGYSVENTQRLLDAGADPNQRLMSGATALMRTPFTPAMQALLNAGADIHARDDDGKTALMHKTEARHNNHEAVAFLLINGAELEATDNLGRTALLHSAQNDPWPNAFDVLVSAGANIHATDHKGQDILFYASENHGFLKTESYQLLLKLLSE